MGERSTEDAEVGRSIRPFDEYYFFAFFASPNEPSLVPLVDSLKDAHGSPLHPVTFLEKKTCLTMFVSVDTVKVYEIMVTVKSIEKM